MNSKKENQIEQLCDKLSNFSIIMSMMSNLVVPEGLPEELEDDFGYWLIETLLTNNTGMIVKAEDGYHLVHGTAIDNGSGYDDFGFGKDYVAHTRMGREFRGKLNDTGVIVRPFSSRRPIKVFQKLAEDLAELDMSEKFLVKWSRVAPFFITNDTRTKEALVQVIKSVWDGNILPMVSDNILKPLTENSKPVELIDVMQSDRVKDLQYLEQHKETIIKHIAELFGLPYQVSTKKAQQSVDEINSGNGGISYIIPMDIKKNFDIFSKNIKKAFGIEVKFSLSPLILSEMEKYFQQPSEDTVGENIEDELTGEEVETDDDRVEREDE